MSRLLFWAVAVARHLHATPANSDLPKMAARRFRTLSHSCPPTTTYLLANTLAHRRLLPSCHRLLPSRCRRARRQHSLSYNVLLVVFRIGFFLKEIREKIVAVRCYPHKSSDFAQRDKIVIRLNDYSMSNALDECSNAHSQP